MGKYGDVRVSEAVASAEVLMDLLEHHCLGRVHAHHEVPEVVPDKQLLVACLSQHGEDGHAIVTLLSEEERGKLEENDGLFSGKQRLGRSQNHAIEAVGVDLDEPR